MEVVPGAASTSAPDLPVKGARFAPADEVLAENWAGAVMIDPRRLSDAQMELLMHARLGGLHIYTVADFSEAMWHKVPVRHLDNEWFAFAGGFDLVHDRISWRIKRLSDVVVAGLMLVLVSWFMLLTAIAVRLSSRGPVIYSQVRTGLRELPFTIYKFRTMRVDAEAASGAIWAQKGDPRVTWLGRIMRTTRADELPQLWNILRGEMSFIGPRPERPELVEKLEQHIPYFTLRHLVKPGLTGWAQVNYPYGSSIEENREKLEYDLYYIKNYSRWLDLVILARTVRVVLFGIGAR
jgi:exopolysaccharide biosynthesis polyprenyl glycosylphosphotransferase